MSESNKWFYIRKGFSGDETLGPFTTKQIARLALKGKLKSKSKINKAGTKQWAELNQIAEIVLAIEQARQNTKLEREALAEEKRLAAEIEKAKREERKRLAKETNAETAIKEEKARPWFSILLLASVSLVMLTILIYGLIGWTNNQSQRASLTNEKHASAWGVDEFWNHPVFDGTHVVRPSSENPDEIVLTGRIDLIFRVNDEGLWEAEAEVLRSKVGCVSLKGCLGQFWYMPYPDNPNAGFEDYNFGMTDEESKLMLAKMSIFENQRVRIILLRKQLDFVGSFDAINLKVYPLNATKPENFAYYFYRWKGIIQQSPNSETAVERLFSPDEEIELIE